MSPGDTPAVARRKVRLAIKDARNAKGDTQTQVAEAMEWSLSKVMRIESGEVTISKNDLRPLLAYLGIKDRKIVEDLLEATAAARQRKQWWDDKRYQGALLTPAMRQLISFEAEASSIRSFAPTTFPGWLQTERYARAILEGYAYEIAADVIEARMSIRAERRKMLRGRDPRPALHALVDESILRREVGGVEVLREQLAAIGAAIEEGLVVVRIHPSSRPVPPFGHFDLLSLAGETDGHAVLYRESGLSDEIVDDAVKIARHREGWDRTWEAALDEKISAGRIAAAAAGVGAHPAGSDLRTE
ncbi:helix-turn-helix transcriptional regulator [Dactylosporangium sp. NPDC051485]|uniref:helix-turn-helix domain-containing protein n=1 Tax=Dactylosporangium sp. NPDC051485 TaxID=3154846 RepID=UPI00344680BF